MNIRDMEYLVALEETQNFRKAAERCHVSQPTLSTQIKKMEETLEVVLIERGNRHCLITPAGKQIVDKARKILMEMSAIQQIANRHADPFQGTLKLGMIPTVAPYLVPLIIPVLHQNYPNLDLNLTEVKTEVMVRQIQQGNLELGILAVPADVQGLEQIELYEESFFLAVHQDNPLAKLEVVELDKLEGQRLLLLEEGHCLRGQALAVCYSSGAREIEEFRGTSLETVKSLVSIGYGCTLLPELVVRQLIDNANDGIVTVPFREPVPARRIALIYRSSTASLALIQALAKDIRQMLRPLLNKKEVRQTIIPVH